MASTRALVKRRKAIRNIRKITRTMELIATARFRQALDRAIRFTVPKPSVLVMGYPSNPTAFVADLDFYRDLVAFAKKHEIFILSDLAYAEVYFDDNNPPPSVLQVPGAMDIAVEFTSMSKTYSMPGWRMGFAVGNERIIAALARVKSYLDYGAFTPIQVAATAALNGPDDCIREIGSGGGGLDHAHTECVDLTLQQRHEQRRLHELPDRDSRRPGDGQLR